MNILNSAVLAAAGKGFKAIFLSVKEKLDTSWNEFLTVIKSESEEESYSWLEMLGGMREWVGDRIVYGLKAFGFTLRNKDWERTIGVDRNTFLYDKLAQVRIKIQGLANAWNNHIWEMLGDLIINGFTSLCYDGQYFFDTDHPMAGQSFSNKGTARLSGTSLAVAIAQMQLTTDDEGKSLRVGNELTLVVGPLEAQNARVLLTADVINGTTNTMKGAAKLKVLPDIKNHAWFLFDLTQAIKPFVLQIVKEGEFVAMDQPSDENVFMRKEFRYGVDSTDIAGYTLWQLAYGSTGASES